MKLSWTVKLAWTLAAITALVIILVPFYALLTVWPASAIGHYTALRLWDDDLTILLSVGSLALLVADKEARAYIRRSQLFWLILGFIALELLTGWAARAGHQVTTKALGYGWMVDLRFLAFFLITLNATMRIPWLRNHWKQLLLWPAAVVVLFGLLQMFVLPHDVLKHFGYGPNTILPTETVDQNERFIRIMSTLRGSNPLGAYLITVLTAIAALFLKSSRRGRFGYGVFGVAAGVVLFGSYSRAAWLGAVVSGLAFLVVVYKTPRARRNLAVACLAVVVVAGVVTLGFRDNSRFQDIFFHTSQASTSAASSNANHASALNAGLRDLERQPLGRGPGTAGPASVYNTPWRVRIAENFYIQIGQETGWLGLAIFLLINVLTGLLLWRRRDSTLAVVLFCSFLGVSLANMFSHAWADDTLAFVWWGLAGIALAPDLTTKLTKKTSPTKTKKAA